MYLMLDNNKILFFTTRNVKGAVEVNAVIPEIQEGENAFYLDGAIVVRPCIDPAEERRKAYVAEADPHLIASLGYEIEGDTVRAEEEAQAYLAAKSAIRERYPDELA